VLKKILLLTVVAMFTLWISACRSGSASQAQLRPAPDFSLTAFDGRPLSLSANRGKVVLLDFWATWCEPCKAEIPHFVDLQNHYGSQGLQIIGLSMDDDEQAARDFYQHYKMNYPVALASSRITDQYGGVLGLPITFAIDRQGRIVSRHIGATDPAVFESEVKKLLGN